jgi:Protein of unknown function (DUF2848)
LFHRLHLELAGATLEFVVGRALIAGYTGRDAAKVHAHIEELECQGIPAPARVPTMYEIDPSLVTTASEIVIGSRRISGEVEAALLFQSNLLDDAFVAVASDFTDREEERRSIQRSKEFPKPLGKSVWKYQEVAGFWDAIALRSWVERGGNPPPLYQSGLLESLFTPPDLLARLNLIPGSDLEGTVILMGTVPLLTKEFQFTDYFACELETPAHKKLSLECRLNRAQARSNP